MDAPTLVRIAVFVVLIVGGLLVQFRSKISLSWPTFGGSKVPDKITRDEALAYLDAISRAYPEQMTSCSCIAVGIVRAGFPDAEAA